MKTLTESNKTMVVGLGLVAIGAIVFLAQFVEIGFLMLPLLATMFLILGITTRVGGWFIPSGILYGISGGVWLIENVAKGNESQEGGMFMLTFAAGWLLVSLLPRLFRTEDKHDWALIVAGIMVVIGLAALGTANVGIFGTIAEWTLRGLGYAWPLALIGWGAWLVIKRNKTNESKE